MPYLYPLYIVTGLAVLISLIANRDKTLNAFKMAAKRFVTILPAFLAMLVLVSIILFFVSDELIITYLGSDNKLFGVLFASAIGSVTLMPGFIAFPLCGILLKEGVLYMVLSAFTTTLMMVGILTYPIEKEYLGAKVNIIRNVISFLIALVIAVITGIFFGEIF